MSLVAYMKEKHFTCVIASSGNIVYESSRSGLKPLIDFYLKVITPEHKCLTVVDKIIGKAAACFLIELPVEYVYAMTISESALELLESFNIKVEYERIVPNIQNRDKSGICPMEQIALSSSTPKETIDKILDIFAIKN